MKTQPNQHHNNTSQPNTPTSTTTASTEPTTQPNQGPTLLPSSQEHPVPYRHAFSPRYRVAFETIGPSRTIQSFKDECDINTIMARYQQTGVLPVASGKIPRYEDLTGYDFQEAQNIIAEGKSMFASLPAALRAEFDNDPALFLDFASNPDNREEMAELGLLKPEAASQRQQATPVATPPTGSAPSPLPANPSGISQANPPSINPSAAKPD